MNTLIFIVAFTLGTALGAYLGAYLTRLRKTRNKDRAFGSHRYYWVSSNPFNPRKPRRCYSDHEDRESAQRAEANPEDFR